MISDVMRRTLAGLAGVAGGLCLIAGVRSNGDNELLIPMVELIIAAVLVHVPSLGAQLGARAVWWSNLGLGTIICLLGNSRSSHSLPAFGFVVFCAIALLGVGRQGLGEAGERGGYAPAAFRSSLLLLMVLALADAQTFFLFVVLLWRDQNGTGTTLLLAPATALYVVGFVALYRLRPWGAVLDALTSVVVFVVAFSEVLLIDRELRQIAEVLTAVHVLAAAPMLVALFTGRRLPQASARVRAVLGACVILALVAASGCFAFRPFSSAYASRSGFE